MKEKFITFLIPAHHLSEKSIFIKNSYEHFHFFFTLLARDFKTIYF